MQNFKPPDLVVATYGYESAGTIMRAGGASFDNTVDISTTNLARFIPFVLSSPFVVANCMHVCYRFGHSGNVDFGIYDKDLIRLASLGAGVAQIADVNVNALSITLQPGLYYMAAVKSDNSNGLVGWTNVPTNLSGPHGCFQVASAYPLPAGPVTPAAYAATVIPLLALGGALL